MYLPTIEKVLVAVAIPEEISLNQWSNRGNIFYTGIGKINTCINLYGAIMNFKPDLVLNLGSAGSLKKDLRGVVEVSSVIERDFDARPLCERGLIPFEDHKNKYSSGFDGVICGHIHQAEIKNINGITRKNKSIHAFLKSN